MSDSTDQGQYAPDDARPEAQKKVPIEIDIYGFKTTATPSKAPDVDPKSWGEVADQIRQKLRNIARDAVGLVADSFEAGRALVRGVGQLGHLPTALVGRVARAHAKADATEDQKQAAFERRELTLPDEGDVKDRLSSFMTKMALRGIRVEVTRSETGLPILVLVPDEAQESAIALANADLLKVLPPPEGNPFQVVATPEIVSQFVVVGGNKAAYEAATKVAETPGAFQKILFIYGKFGTGKTHLLHLLCRWFAERHPTKKWAYITGYEFANRFLVAVRDDELDRFSEALLRLDMLVVDEINFLGKGATQEEFLRLANEFNASGRQLVVAGVQHPRSMAQLNRLLKQKFAEGLVVRIDPPRKGARRNLVHQILSEAGIQLTKDAIELIANHEFRSPRELKGTLAHIAASKKLLKEPNDLELAKEALSQLSKPVC